MDGQLRLALQELQKIDQEFRIMVFPKFQKRANPNRIFCDFCLIWARIRGHAATEGRLLSPQGPKTIKPPHNKLDNDEQKGRRPREKMKVDANGVATLKPFLSHRYDYEGKPNPAPSPNRQIKRKRKAEKGGWKG